MKQKLVLSKSIAVAGFDESADVLEIEFYNGLVYRITGVDWRTCEGLFQKHTADKCLKQLLANGYKFERVAEVPAVFLG